MLFLYSSIPLDDAKISDLLLNTEAEQIIAIREEAKMYNQLPETKITDIKKRCDGFLYTFAIVLTIVEFFSCFCSYERQTARVNSDIARFNSGGIFGGVWAGCEWIEKFLTLACLVYFVWWISTMACKRRERNNRDAEAAERIKALDQA